MKTLFVRLFFSARLAALSLLVLLQACSGGSGGGSSQQDSSAVGGGDTTGSFTYSGPSPANNEVQIFKREFYDNVVVAGRCGDCHTSGGPGPTLFADKDDVNNAWQQARTVVNLADPASSQVVQRVANGHNCWLGADQTATCRTSMIGYISNWATGANGGVTTVQLLPRTPVDPAASIIFPATPPAAFSGAVDRLHDVLQTYCSNCHKADANFPQSPYFASTDINEAYEAVKSKVDLNEPEKSRFLVRLREEGHNCGDQCSQIANEIETAIAAIINEITSGVTPAIDAALQRNMSKAQVLSLDGILASSGGRYEDDIIAEWKFSEGLEPADIATCMANSQCTSADTSGVQPEITLSLQGDVELFSSGGIRFNSGSARGLASTSIKLRDRLAAAGEYSIEAWVIPDNVSQEDTSIISYSGISNNRNLLFGQTLYNYDFYNRSSVTDANGSGSPALSTDDDDEFAQATLQHVVLTYDPVNGRRIYVNGVFTGVDDAQGGGNMSNWNDAFSVVIGNDASGSRPWKGILRYMALHSRALTEQQIQQNNDVGIGLDYFLLFSVSELINQEGVCHTGSGASRVNYCYIMFTVSQFDEYSYQFSDPAFISLDEDNFTLSDTRIKGIYIGINGKLAINGQAFADVDTTINSNTYTTGGVPLAKNSDGTIIGLERGAQDDQFFLVFEDFDGTAGVELTPLPGPTAFVYSLNGQPVSDVAVKTFDEINQSFASITGINSTTSNIYDLFHGDSSVPTDQGIKRQFPSIEDLATYQGAHQTAVLQLAMAYCDALVEDSAKRDAFFNDGAALNFSTRADLVSDNDWRTKVIVPLLEAALVFDTGASLELSSQPNQDNARDDLLLLINDTADVKPYSLTNGSYVSNPDAIPDGLARCSGGACPAGRTGEVVKAVCATVLGSAAVLLQ